MATASFPKTNIVESKFRSVSRSSHTVWDYHTFTSFQFPSSEYESCTRKVEVLREKIYEMLMASSENPMENVKLIYLLFRLGVSYHFEKEIEDQLDHIFDALPNILNDNDHDLYTISLLFVVMRQHGYRIPSDVFKKFKDEDGKFKKAIGDEVREVIGLYEASFFSVHGEEILDEALAFTRPMLESLAKSESISPHLAHYIRTALILPFHKSLPRIEARHFINFYHQDGSPNPILLEFAILDYNRVQLLHKQELSELVRWWKQSKIAEKHPYARDRIVEVYFFACGGSYKPQYALSRLLTVKCAKTMSLCDDTYDSYASIDEIKLFASAAQRFDRESVAQLPDYMKDIYEAILDRFEEIEKLCKNGTSYRLHYAKETFKELLNGYHVEARWVNEGHVPTFGEYISNGYSTSVHGQFSVLSLVGMEEFAGINEFQWLSSKPKIALAGRSIWRLMNDLFSHEEEQEWGDCATGVECYMKEHNASKEEAIKEIRKICNNVWKDMNETCMKPTIVSRPILDVLINLARAAEVVYRFDDAYTHPLSLKADVTSLFIDPIPILPA